MTGDKSIGTNRYFGGGSVDVVLSGQHFAYPRSEPSAASSFVHGSVHFRGISTLVHGFEEVKRVGGMDKVSPQSWEYYTEVVFTFMEGLFLSANPCIVPLTISSNCRYLHTRDAWRKNSFKD